MSLPLEGVRVLDLSLVWAIPYACGQLADMGAQIIKIEHRARPDQRIAGPYPNNQAGERYWEESGTWNTIHRNKLSITLDLNHPDAAEVFRQLVRVSDVVTENFTPRVLRNFGLDYSKLREINPSIIMLSNTGYGQTGPWQNYTTIGLVIEPTSGLSHLTGYPDAPPILAGYAHNDFPTCWNALFAITSALHYRRRTGRGLHIDLAMYEVGAATIGEAIMDAMVNGRVTERMGNREGSMAPHGCYPCLGNDKWVTIAVGSDAEFARLCRVMEQPEMASDPRFADVLSRWKHQDELDAIIAAWTSSRDHYDVMNVLQAAGVPSGAVLNNKELLFDPQLKARGFYEMLEHHREIPRVGRRPYITRPWKLSKTPGTLRTPAPMLGMHNAFVLGELLDFPQEKIAALVESGAVGTEPEGVPPTANPMSVERMLETGRIVEYDPDYKRVLGIETAE